MKSERFAEAVGAVGFLLFLVAVGVALMPKKQTTPYVGQHVLYFDTAESKPLAAIVTLVTSDVVVNAAVFSADGSVQPKQGVNFVRKGEALPTARYCMEK